MILATGDAAPPGCPRSPAPGPSRLSQRAFLDQHRPDAAVFAGPLDPHLLSLLDRHALPALWIDATAPAVRRWPRLARASPESGLQVFERILTATGAEADRLVRLRGVAGKLETPGPLLPSICPLPYSVRRRDALARLLAGRPIWMATDPHPSEIPMAVEAHRLAIGQSHRLLLVLAIGPDGAEGLATGLRAAGWHVALRSAGDEPQPEVQIVLADDPDELGLWYRLAPICFLGGTLSGTGARRPPFEAAALGSALIHGPRVAPHEAEIRRLAMAGAARRVETPDSLARAVARLLSADVAAGLATAAWDVVTAGAPAMTRAAELIEDLLERRVAR